MGPEADPGAEAGLDAREHVVHRPPDARRRLHPVHALHGPAGVSARGPGTEAKAWKDSCACQEASLELGPCVPSPCVMGPRVMSVEREETRARR